MNEYLAASLMHAVVGASPVGPSRIFQTIRSSYAVRLETLTDVTTHPEWPVNHISTGRIFVVPKDSVSAFKYRWYGAITLQTEERRFVVTPDAGLFPRGTKKFLEENGWL